MYYGRNRGMLLNKLSNTITNMRKDRISYKDRSHIILPHDPRARRLFVTSGGLKKVQEIQADPGSTLLEYIQIINCCFPDEIVRYYSPGYPNSLLEAVEQYQPKCPSLFGMEEHLSSDIDSKSSLSSFNEEG